MNGSSQKSGPTRSRRYRVAWIVSIVAHVVLLTVAAMWYVNHRSQQRQANSLASTTGSTGETRQRAPSPEVTEQQVTATLEKTLDVYEDKPSEEQLDLLDQKAKRLEEISSEESISEIADRFHEWMKTDSRASEPKGADPATDVASADAKATPGDDIQPETPQKFDFDTAQIHEIRREESEDGYRYLTVLVDADGLTMETELHGEEGETAYATFQRLKKFPLANQVYRKIAMPLMDKVLAAEKAATQVNRKGEASDVDLEAETETSDEAEDNRDPFDAG